MLRSRINFKLVVERSKNITAFLLTAVLGATISYYVNLGIDWSQNKNNISIDGRWLSASCDRTSEGNGYIVLDKLDIGVTYLNGIQMRNTIHNIYDYDGHGNIYEGKYFYGTWRSLKKGANTKGAFSFTISPQGDFMAGTFTGADDLGEYTQCWILGRSKRDLEKGFEIYKKQLFEMRDLKLPVRGG